MELPFFVYKGMKIFYKFHPYMEIEDCFYEYTDESGAEITDIEAIKEFDALLGNKFIEDYDDWKYERI